MREEISFNTADENNYVNNECIDEHYLLQGLLTKGFTYKCIAKNSLGDLLILKDDKGNKRWYRDDLFLIKCNSNKLDKLPTIKARI